MNHILCTTFELNNKPYIHKVELVGISAKRVNRINTSATITINISNPTTIRGHNH